MAMVAIRTCSSPAVSASACFPNQRRWQQQLQLHGSSRRRSTELGLSLNRILRSSPITHAGTTDGKLVADQSAQQLKEANEVQIQKQLQALAECMALPDGYLSQLPNDLRGDLKDAAFALASGPLQRECGERAGAILTQLSRAWEKGDTQASASAAKQFQDVLSSDLPSRAAIGRRLIGAGRRFASTGTYAKGELQKIANTLIASGEALCVGDTSETRQEPLLPATRVYKFGDLQVELTAQKCYIGSAFALFFGALSWELTSSLQSISENSSQYDGALALTSALKGTVLVLAFSCTALSSLAAVGLLGLAIQLSTKGNTNN